MNLKTLLEISHKFTAKGSDMCRMMAYFAFPLVWFLTTKSENGVLSKALAVVLSLIIGSLLLDLLQYAYQGLVWRSVHAEKEEKLGYSSKKEFSLDPGPANLSYDIFKVKIVMVVFAYVILFANILGPVFK